MNRPFLFGLLGLLLIALVGSYVILQSGNGGGETTLIAGQDPQSPQSAAGNENQQLSYTAYPEYQPVINPNNLQEYMALHPSDTVYGNEAAPVTVMEFFSYACGFCQDFYQGVYQTILAEYVDTGLVRFVKRDFLLQDEEKGLELYAGAGAECFIDDGQSQRFDDLMFAQRTRLLREPDPRAALLPLFLEAGLEETQARECMDDLRSQSLVYYRAARANGLAGVEATPTVFINQRRFSGIVNSQELIEAIEAALAAN